MMSRGRTWRFVNLAGVLSSLMTGLRSFGTDDSGGKTEFTSAGGFSERSQEKHSNVAAARATVTAKRIEFFMVRIKMFSDVLRCPRMFERR